MKCIKNKHVSPRIYKRVNDKEAEKLVKSNKGWVYCPKTEFKNQLN